MTPEEELLKIKTKEKRHKRDMYYFVAGFVVAFAFVGFALVASM